MHLVYLGVMKRLFSHIWLGTLPHCWSAEERKLVSSLLTSFVSSYPKEYKRKGRGLEDIKYWESVEFLSFLLYSGPLILKRVLCKDKFEHFLYFHVAIRILTSPSLNKDEDKKEIQFAENCLKYFVDKLGQPACTAVRKRTFGVQRPFPYSSR